MMSFFPSCLTARVVYVRDYGWPQKGQEVLAMASKRRTSHQAPGCGMIGADMFGLARS